MTDTLEFFITDPCGLEKFDILILQGSKRNTRIQLSKITKTSREKLRELAGNSYNEEDTVVQVKRDRYGKKRLMVDEVSLPPVVSKPEELENNVMDTEELTEQEDSINPLLEHAKEILNEIVDPNLTLVIDNSQLKNVEDMQYLIQLIKNNPGKRKATILGKEFLISEDAVKELREWLKL